VPPRFQTWLVSLDPLCWHFGVGILSRPLSFVGAMKLPALNGAILVGVPALGDVSQELENCEVFIPSDFTAILIQGCRGLPISCLSYAPTAGNVGPTKASPSNSLTDGL